MWFPFPRNVMFLAFVGAVAACSGGDDTPQGSVDTASPSTGTNGTVTQPTGTTDSSPTPTDSAGDTGSTPGCSETVEIDVGVGEFEFQPLAVPTDAVQVVYGAQGGWHLEIAGMVSGTGQEVAVEAPLVRVVDDDIQIAGSNQQPTYLPLNGYDQASCTGSFAGVRAFIDDYLPDVPYHEFVCSLEGKLVEVELTVSDLHDAAIQGTSTGTGTIVLDETFKQESCR